MNYVAGSISVLLATRNRKEILDQFLERVADIDHPQRWEVVVVDNGSTDGTAEVVARFAKRFPVKTLHEPAQGKSRALNKGISNASGELLVFVDDDIEPAQDWLTAWEQAMAEHPEANVFGGRISIEKGLLPAWLERSYNLKNLLAAEHDLGPESLRYPHNQYPWGPNIAVRHSALEGVACPWPEDVGPGCRLPVGDEYAFLAKISRPSAQDRLYVPASSVVHRPEAKDIVLPGSALRCFQGGLASGLLHVNDSAATDSLPERSATGWFGSRVIDRLRACCSWRELFLICVRATGTLSGSVIRRLRGSTIHDN